MKKFKFSQSGNKFVIAGSMDLDTLDIYDSSQNLDTLLTGSVSKSKYLQRLTAPDLKETKKVVFGPSEEQLFIGTNRQILIFNIKTGAQIKNIPIHQCYEKLLSFMISDDGSVMISCKRNDAKIIDLIKANKNTRNIPLKSIRYNNEQTEYLKCEISKDHNRCFINNGEDNVFFNSQNEIQLQGLSWFKDRVVHKMREFTLPSQQNAGDHRQNQGFLCLTSKIYDSELTILHTDDPQFKIEISRSITMNNYSVNDFIVTNEGKVRILSVRDGELFNDLVDLKYASAQREGGSAKDELLQQVSYYNSPFESLKFQWPYTYYIHQGNFALIISANLPDYIYKFNFPQEKRRISNLYVTEKHELYFAVSGEGNYSIYQVTDSLKKLLDPSTANPTIKKYNFKLLLTYPSSMIPGNHPIYQLWVKSSTTKPTSISSQGIIKSIQNNQGSGGQKSDTRMFMLHRQTLLSCVEGQEKPIPVAFMRRPKYVDQDNIFYETSSDLPGDRESRPTIFVKRLSIVYSTLKKDIIYQEKNPYAKISSFSYDYGLNRVYVLVKDKSTGKPKYNVAIVDALNLEILTRIEIGERNSFVGKFKGGIHFLINGNFYYQNSVIRLDPLNQKHVVFQRYDHLIPCQENFEKVIYLCPMISSHYRKMLYIKKETSGRALRTAIIIPFMDERRIIISNKNYQVGQIFWNIIDTYSSQSNRPLILQLKNQAEEIKKDEKVLETRNDIDENQYTGNQLLKQQSSKKTGSENVPMIESHLQKFNSKIELLEEESDNMWFPQEQNKKGTIWRKCFSWTSNNRISMALGQGQNNTINITKKPSFPKLVSIDIPDSKVQIFSLQGQLQQVIHFFPSGDQAENEAIAISQDGNTFVFKSQDNLNLYISALDIENNSGFQNSSSWKAKIDDIVLKNEKALNLLLPDFKVNLTSQQSLIRQAQKKQNDSLSLEGLNVAVIAKQASEIDNRGSSREQEDGSFIALETPLQQVNSLLNQIYLIKVQVNNQGDLCISFVENRSHAFARNFEHKSGQKFMRLLDPKQQVKNTTKGKEDYRGEKQQDIKDQLYGIHKDLKRRVFMVIKRPKQENLRPEIFMIDNKKHFPQIKFPKFFLISKESIFFWNLQKVYFWQFSKMKRDSDTPIVKSIGFQIPNEDWARCIIKSVTTSGRDIVDDKLAIQVTINQKQDTVIIWDLKGDIEFDSYDVSPESQVMFDQRGEIFILEKDHVIINHSGCRCFSFEVEGNFYFNIWKDEKVHNDFQKLDRGYRIDPINHNYILTPNILYLSQSYLSIVINLQNAEKEYSEKVFDPLAFPYYFNRKSELHQLVGDPNGLDQLLNYYQEKDPRLLDHILIVDVNDLSPLHIATEAGVSKTISMLLKMLSQVRINNATLLKDIFDNFLDYVFFKDYLNVCYFQTVQMKGIQSLNIPKMNGDESEHAIVVSHNNSLMNKDLLNQVLQDDAASIPVSVKGFDLYWILNTKSGKNFLLKLSEQENYDFFTTEFVSTLIYFLWSHYKYRIILFQMIPFCIYFGVFIALVFFNENYFELSSKKDQSGIKFEENEKQTMLGLSITVLILIAYFFGLYFRAIYSLGIRAWQFLWVWINFTSHILNLAIVILILSDGSIIDIRRIESFAVVLMWLKFLYFFRILDNTAPFIRMIYQIIYDMRAFVFIFVIIMLGFANGFYVLAKNQKDLMTSDANDSDIPYLTYGQSIIYVYLMAIGEYSTDSFTLGNDNDLLWAFFILTTFMLAIVMLNMLIAMMGQSYDKMSLVAEASMLKERMGMIMENYFLMRSKAFVKAKYLISFSATNQNVEEESTLKIVNLMEKIVQQNKDLETEMQAIRQMIHNTVKKENVTTLVNG